MKQARKSSLISIIVIVVMAVVVAAIVATTVIGGGSGHQPGVTTPTLEDGQSVTLDGTILCLPHKNTSGPQTEECAYGFKDDNNIYYSLRDDTNNYSNFMGQPMNSRVRIVGTFHAQTATTIYQDVGTITITSITKL